MRRRDSALVYAETQSADNSSKTIDLDITDPVTGFYLEFDATNGTTNNADNFISDVITKVEIVDGSEVLWSLPFDMLEALHFYKLKQPPTLFPSEWPSGHQRHGALLMFGRRLYDQEFAMDFTKLRNPQMKISWNLGAIRAVSATTAFATGTLQITVIAKIMEDVPMPTKYLMAKLIDEWTCGTSGDERKELPNDYIYRLLMTRHWLEAYDVDEITSDLKLTMDADKFIVFNRKVKQLDAEALAEFGPVQYKHDFKQAYPGPIRLLVNKEPFVTPWVRDPGTPRQFVPYAQWSSDFYFELYDLATPSIDSAARRSTSYVHGHALHATVPIPMGLMDDPATWFDPTGYRKPELVLTNGGTAGTCEIILEQSRPL